MSNKGQREELGRQQQGSEDPSTEPSFLLIGRALRPHGVRGEVRVEVHTDVPERFTWLEFVYLSTNPDDLAPLRVGVERARLHKGYVLLKLAGYDGRDAAERLRSMWFMVPEEDALPLEEDEVFLYQLEGLKVHTDEGEYLGELSEVLDTNANYVFIVHGPRGEILLPNTEEVVVALDLEAGTLTVHLIPGLLP